jgi:type I restriction enzyme S subunit
MKTENKKITNVPNLRFPGYTEDWHTKQLGNIMEFKTTNSFSREYLSYHTGTVKNVHYGDIHTKFQTLFDITQENVPFINNDINLQKIPEENYCKEGDIVFADASEDLQDVGKCIEIVNVDGQKLLSGLHTLLGRPKLGFFHLGFNGYLLQSLRVKRQIQKESQGSKVLSINVARISKIKLSFPNITEQERIAVLFRLFDQRIQTQNKIIQELKSLKNATIKSIFNKEVQFKNEQGNSFPEWQKKNLGNLTTVVNNRNKKNEKLPVYSINNKKGYVPQGDQFEGVDSNSRGYDMSIYKVIKNSTFAYNPARINVGSIGYSGNLDNILVSSLYVCFKTTLEIDDEFLLQYVKMESFNQQVLEFMEGGVRSYLFYEKFSKITLALPCLEEQIKIAKMLRSIDRIISNEDELLEKMFFQKKYLLINLFI